MKTELFIGVMSGTSMDGIDVALCAITSSTCKLVHSREYPFCTKIKEEILELLQGTTTLKQIGELDYRLGVIFADAINDFIAAYALKRENISAVGVHGQTLFHSPASPYPFSLQLGSGSVIAARTALDVVCDFRNKDLAFGGEGAPFAPAFHQFLFQKAKKKTAVVNIGGMANISLIEPKRLSGWDSGCGNVLLDYCAKKYFNKPCDKEGEIARRGRVSHTLLHKMLQDPYFGKKPPKSTGREYFNPSWLEKMLLHVNITPTDLLATLTELTAHTIVQDILPHKPEEILLCGGGAKNSFLKERIATLADIPLSTTDTYGINSNFLEAMLIAWLAAKRLRHETTPLHTVTGAMQDTVLGCVYT